MIKNAWWSNLSEVDYSSPSTGTVTGIVADPNAVFTVNTSGGQLCGDSWYQVWGSNMVGSLDVSKDWEFSADITLGSNNYNFGSLIRFTATGGNYGTYGDEILNIDVTSWNELFIASDTLDYPDIY